MLMSVVDSSNGGYASSPRGPGTGVSSVSKGREGGEGGRSGEGALDEGRGTVVLFGVELVDVMGDGVVRVREGVRVSTRGKGERLLVDTLWYFDGSGDA